MKKVNAKLFLGMFLLFVACVGCNSKQSQQKEGDKLQVVGNAKDDHGCLISAGYQWSELLKDCIRPFEKGMKLKGETKSNETMAAYLVFNADSSKVEVFMPKGHPILSRTAERTTWKNDGKISVKVDKDAWMVQEGSEVLFKK